MGKEVEIIAPRRTSVHPFFNFMTVKDDDGKKVAKFSGGGEHVELITSIVALHYIRLQAYQGEPDERTERRASLADELRHHHCDVKTLKDGTVEISIVHQRESTLRAMTTLFAEYGFPVTLESSSSSIAGNKARHRDHVLYDESKLCAEQTNQEDGRFHPHSISVALF